MTNHLADKNRWRVGLDAMARYWWVVLLAGAAFAVVSGALQFLDTLEDDARLGPEWALFGSREAILANLNSISLPTTIVAEALVAGCAHIYALWDLRTEKRQRGWRLFGRLLLFVVFILALYYAAGLLSQFAAHYVSGGNPTTLILAEVLLLAGLLIAFLSVATILPAMIDGASPSPVAALRRGGFLRLLGRMLAIAGAIVLLFIPVVLIMVGIIVVTPLNFSSIYFWITTTGMIFLVLSYGWCVAAVTLSEHYLRQEASRAKAA